MRYYFVVERWTGTVLMFAVDGLFECGALELCPWTGVSPVGYGWGAGTTQSVCCGASMLVMEDSYSVRLVVVQL